MENYLFTLFILPFLGSIFAFLFKSIPKSLAFVLSILPLLLLILFHQQWINADYNYFWLPQLSINFHLHVDSLSLVFLYLTTLIVPISILAIPITYNHKNSFYGLILFLEGLLIGFFTSRDLAFFTLFWEAMLLPLYFIISIWGKEKSEKAAMQFLIYMIAGSVLMVAAVLALYFISGSFDMSAITGIVESSNFSIAVFLIFLLAFAVKTPLFPFHAWLPDAYYFAPTSGTILLSAILSKAGIYGILRISLGFFPNTLEFFSPYLIGLAFFGVFYGGLAAWMQNDYKRLIAYSSFSHVNFILAGIFLVNVTGETGAIVQAVNHSITITALFLAASWLEERIGTTSMDPISGLAKYFPHLCWLTLFFVLSNVALPGTNNFIGELLILFGTLQRNFWLTFILASSVILSAIYMLRWMQNVYFGTPSNLNGTIEDIQISQLLLALPLIFLILWIGLFPQPLIDLIRMKI